MLMVSVIAADVGFHLHLEICMIGSCLALCRFFLGVVLKFQWHHSFLGRVPIHHKLENLNFVKFPGDVDMKPSL